MTIKRYDYKNSGSIYKIIVYVIAIKAKLLKRQKIISKN